MQPGQAQQSAPQAQQLAQQVRFAQQQAQFGLQAHQRSQQRRRKRRTQPPSTVVPGDGWSPGTQAAKPARKLAKWLVAVVIIFWAVPIATRVEWVRQHDGPVTPVPYSLAVTVSVLAGLLLAPYMLGRRRPPSA